MNAIILFMVASLRIAARLLHKKTVGLKKRDVQRKFHVICSYFSGPGTMRVFNSIFASLSFC